MDNPLLDFSGLPRFAAIRAEHVAPAIDPLLEAGRACVERLAVDDRAPTWDNFIEPLDDANERLARAWSHVGHLNAVVSTPALRDAYNTMLPKVTQYFTEQGQDQRLHARLRALRESGGFAALTPARSYKPGGVAGEAAAVANASGATGAESCGAGESDP